jgi:hypothetical protein
MAKVNLCTLFNSAYLSRGLTLYKSLLETNSDFHLYVFAFDDLAYDYLKQKKFEHLTVVSLNEFEDEQLLAIKSTRTAGEYCWTCTPSTIRYCIDKFSLDSCTYIDADMYFYADPEILIDEMGSKSVLITEHRYTKQYDQSDTSGIYCVQFVTFKNNTVGLKVLNWWRNACIEWCYARNEDGKFGDQKYLDDWTTRFEGVHVLKNLGGGLAPWNVQQYKFKLQNGKLTGVNIATGEKFNPLFYHFHDLKLFSNKSVQLTGIIYNLSADVKNLFYQPYIKKLFESKSSMHLKAGNINWYALDEKPPQHLLPKLFMKIIKHNLKAIYSNLRYKRNIPFQYFNFQKM